MSLQLFHCDNREILKHLRETGTGVDLIYADMMYDSLDFRWILDCEHLLKDTGSIFIQTDYRSVAELKFFLDGLFGKESFQNWIIWPYDWGGRSKRRFGRKHDDILWYSKTEEYKFYPERIQIPKKVQSAGLNPSGRTHKIPTDVWDDIGNFHTMDKERLKDISGKAIAWQKPLRLMERIILSTTDEGDTVLDPFLGTGTTGVAALRHGRNFIGIEHNSESYHRAEERIESELKENEERKKEKDI
jgi:site-specific DNA-methyltransferase (adenine-specific)